MAGDMRIRPLLGPLLGALLIASPGPAGADAIVVTKAASSTTILEIFVEKDHVRMDLEIGIRDVAAFADLLPDELYQKLGRPPVSWPDRVERFGREGLSVKADGAPLPLRLEKFESRPRLRRDPHHRRARGVRR